MRKKKLTKLNNNENNIHFPFRSKRYERLRGAARARYETAKKDTRLTYSAIGGVNSTMNYMKMGSGGRGGRPHGAAAGAGRSGRPKKHRTNQSTPT